MTWAIDLLYDERDLDGVLEVEGESFSNPWTRAVQPDPYCTTACIIAVICFAVLALMTCRCGWSITGLILLPIRSTT